MFRTAWQPVDCMAWHLQAFAFTAGDATKCIRLPKAGKMAGMNVNNPPKIANI